MKLLLIFLFFSALFSTANAQTSVRVRHGKPIMIDSIITGNQRTNGKTITVSDEVKPHFKQSGEFIFIGIDAPNQPHLNTDNYLSTGGEIYNLHVSAMLGERILKNGEFTVWDWRNNRGSTANAARILDTIEPKRFLPNDAVEFHISRRHFAGEK